MARPKVDGEFDFNFHMIESGSSRVCLIEG